MEIMYKPHIRKTEIEKIARKLNADKIENDEFYEKVNLYKNEELIAEIWKK